MFEYLNKNNMIDKKHQKGFWPSVDGVGEHTETLTHVIREAKRHQNSLVVTLLDLKNAFGEVQHELIRAALRYHLLPDLFIQLFDCIYRDSSISVASNREWTEFIKVEKGVLQGDPCSPLLFNLCFNLLMQTLAKPELTNLGFIWGPQHTPFECSWLQFADDAAIVSNSPKDTQTLLNIFIAWCNWSCMTIRLDKCITFGMRKYDNVFSQYEPALFVNGEQIPVVPAGGSFTYLGKIFSFDLKNTEAKLKTSEKLTTLLRITSQLKVKSQWKLDILRRYIHTQLAFELRLYDFGVTWIEQHLDSICYQNIRCWLSLPVSSCIKEVTGMSKSGCGLDIPSFRDTFERLWLRKRHKLKHNTDPEIQQIWNDQSFRHVAVDAFLNDDVSAASALSNLRDYQEQMAQTHFYSLNIQCQIVKSVVESVSKQNIILWSMTLESMPQYIFSFARKAILQQLPTASNLHRWKKISSPVCNLCNSGMPQTNKHVMNNCSNVKALERYSQRHDNVLSLLAGWILSTKSTEQELFVDLPSESEKWNPIDQVFQPACRPDILVIEHSKIFVLELTICHETNLINSKNYKINKYNAIHNLLQPAYRNFNVKVFTHEISSLGFIADLSDFRKATKLPNLVKSMKSSLIRSVLNDSYNIYRLRNSLI